MITKLVMTAALLIPITTSAVIAKELRHRATSAAAHPGGLQGYARADVNRHTTLSRSQTVYGYDGRYLGADPDPFIRLQLLRDSNANRY